MIYERRVVSILCFGHKSSTGNVRRLFHQHSSNSSAPIWRQAGGRKNRTIYINFLDIVRYPVKLRYYLKFHSSGIARCLTSARNIKKSLNKSADARLGTGRRFMSPTEWEAMCFCIYIDISLLKTKNVNTKIYSSPEQLRMINMQRTSAIAIFAVMSKCGFHLHHCQSQPQSFLFTTCFFGGIMANFDINLFIIARENSCKKWEITLSE